MGNNKFPGICGISPTFFKVYWDNVHDEVWNTIFNFLKEGIMPTKWKYILVFLISTVQSALKLSKLWPISHSQTTYKIIARMLLNILKIIIRILISEEQVAYVPNRSISDNFQLAQELFKKLIFFTFKKGFISLKVDMEQAYDSMFWETFFQVMK